MTYFLKRSSSIAILTILLISGGMIAVPISTQAANAEGLYSGAFSGEQTGTWFLHIDGSGNGHIYFWLKDGQVVDSGSAKLNGTNSFSFSCTYGISGSGAIKADGHTEGSWRLGGASGELRGTSQDPAKIKALAGTYSGRGTGNESGQWQLTVADTGLITGKITWDKSGLFEEGNGIINSNGNFIFLTQDDTSTFGKISSSKAINGEWNNPFWETKGTLGKAKKVNKSTNASKTAAAVADDDQHMPVLVDAEDANGNGCFIQAIAAH